MISFGGLAIDALTEAEVVEHVVGELRARRGGRMVTLNVDIFRAASIDPKFKELIAGASLMVADGMPLVWASKLRHTPVPERVTGSSLIFTLSEAAAEAGQSIYLLGGAPGVPEQAAAALRSRYPALRVVGADSPSLGFDDTPAGLDAVCKRMAAAEPDIVYVGLGFPKQERLIARVAPRMPSAWFIGCGAAISFAAGATHRAPQWMQQAGLEWLYRLITEPRRLARRYLVNDLPFALRLLTSAVSQRRSQDQHAAAHGRVERIRARSAPASVNGQPRSPQGRPSSERHPEDEIDEVAVC